MTFDFDPDAAPEFVTDGIGHCADFGGFVEVGDEAVVADDEILDEGCYMEHVNRLKVASLGLLAENGEW